MTSTKTKERTVAGKTEPRRRTIFGRAYETYIQRATAAWRLGIKLYSSLLNPVWHALKVYTQKVFDLISRLIQRIYDTAKNGKERTLGVLSWFYHKSAKVFKWIWAYKEDTLEMIRAKQARRKVDYNSLHPTTRSNLTALASFLTLGTGLGIVIWTNINWFKPVLDFLSNYLGGFLGMVLTIILSLIFFFFVWAILPLIVCAYFLLALPVLLLFGLIGLSWVGVVSFTYLAFLSILLLTTAAIAVTGLVILLAGMVLLASMATIASIPILIGVIVFGLYIVCLVLLQTLALVFIILSRPGQYMWVLWRGIKYVCPSGRCGSLHVPAHVCTDCGSIYSRLWPSFYGVFDHRCEGKSGSCHRPLPTLELLGRNQMNRVCVNCGMQFVSRSSGKLPVTVVGFAGGTSVGKTMMMLMMTAELIGRTGKKHDGITAKIDSQDQRTIFEREWKRLMKGIRVAPTSGSVPDAFILQVKQGQKKFLLYLYDAPGEEFSYIDRFSQHQWLRHAGGLMILVDPASLLRFEKHNLSLDVGVSQTPINDVVDSCIAATERMVSDRDHGRLSMPLAVVITKADLAGVKQRLKDTSLSDSAMCRNALSGWGAAGDLDVLEKHFSNVRYFACSAQGRTASENDSAPFTAYGVQNPMLWILDGADRSKPVSQRNVEERQ